VLELGRPPELEGGEEDTTHLYSRMEVATAVTLCVGQPYTPIAFPYLIVMHTDLKAAVK